MPTVTVRPNSTVSTASAGIGGGAASEHAALSDNSDTTYVEFQTFSGPATMARYGLPAPTLPAGGRWKTIVTRLRAKVSNSSGAWQVQPNLDIAGVGSFTMPSVSVSSTSIANHSSSAAALPGPTIATALTMRLVSPSQAANLLDVYELYADFVYAAQPTCAVSAPTGTITNNSQPTIAWTHTAGADGGAQTFYEAKVFSAAQYGAGGFDPDTSTATWEGGAAGAATTATPMLLPNGTYRAYVRTAQTINGVAHWSAWDFEGFTLNVTGPTVDTVTPTVVAGGVSVAVDRDTGGEAWDFVDVERSTDAGATWTWVRDAVRAAVAGNTFTVNDQEAPPGTAITYRARGIRVVSSSDIAGEWVSAAATVEWTLAAAWWKDPLNPSLGGTFLTRSKPQPERPIRQGVHRALGARFPVVVSDRRQATVGEWVVQTNDADDTDLFEALLDSNVLLVQTPPGSPWRLGTNGNLYLVAGNIREDDIDRRNLNPHRRWIVPYNEVDRPSADA